MFCYNDSVSVFECVEGEVNKSAALRVARLCRSLLAKCFTGFELKKSQAMAVARIVVLRNTET